MSRPAAACHGYPPDWWFPTGTEHSGTAKRICASCPLREACVAEAIRVNAQGIWGGTTLSERQRQGQRGTREIRRGWVLEATARLVAEGLANDAIAQRLGVSQRVIARARAQVVVAA